MRVYPQTERADALCRLRGMPPLPPGRRAIDPSLVALFPALDLTYLVPDMGVEAMHAETRKFLDTPQAYCDSEYYPLIDRSLKRLYSSLPFEKSTYAEVEKNFNWEASAGFLAGTTKLGAKHTLLPLWEFVEQNPWHYLPVWQIFLKEELRALQDDGTVKPPHNICGDDVAHGMQSMKFFRNYNNAFYELFTDFSTYSAVGTPLDAGWWHRRANYLISPGDGFGPRKFFQFDIKLCNYKIGKQFHRSEFEEYMPRVEPEDRSLLDWTLYHSEVGMLGTRDGYIYVANPSSKSGCYRTSVVTTKFTIRHVLIAICQLHGDRTKYSDEASLHRKCVVQAVRAALRLQVYGDNGIGSLPEDWGFGWAEIQELLLKWNIPTTGRDSVRLDGLSFLSHEFVFDRRNFVWLPVPEDFNKVLASICQPRENATPALKVQRILAQRYRCFARADWWDVLTRAADTVMKQVTDPEERRELATMRNYTRAEVYRRYTLLEHGLCKLSPFEACVSDDNQDAFSSPMTKVQEVKVTEEVKMATKSGKRGRRRGSGKRAQHRQKAKRQRRGRKGPAAQNGPDQRIKDYVTGLLKNRNGGSIASVNPMGNPKQALFPDGPLIRGGSDANTGMKRKRITYAEPISELTFVNNTFSATEYSLSPMAGNTPILENECRGWEKYKLLCCAIVGIGFAPTSTNGRMGVQIITDPDGSVASDFMSIESAQMGDAAPYYRNMGVYYATPKNMDALFLRPDAQSGEAEFLTPGKFALVQQDANAGSGQTVGVVWIIYDVEVFNVIPSEQIAFQGYFTGAANPTAAAPDYVYEPSTSSAWSANKLQKVFRVLSTYADGWANSTNLLQGAFRKSVWGSGGNDFKGKVGSLLTVIGRMSALESLDSDSKEEFVVLHGKRKPSFTKVTIMARPGLSHHHLDRSGEIRSRHDLKSIDVPTTAGDFSVVLWYCPRSNESSSPTAWTSISTVAMTGIGPGAIDFSLSYAISANLLLPTNCIFALQFYPAAAAAEARRWVNGDLEENGVASMQYSLIYGNAAYPIDIGAI